MTGDIHRASQAKIQQLDSMLQRIKNDARQQRNKIINEVKQNSNEDKSPNYPISPLKNFAKSRNSKQAKTPEIARESMAQIAPSNMNEANKFLDELIHNPSKKVSKKDELIAHDAFMNEYHNLATSPSAQDLTPIRIEKIVNLRVQHMIHTYHDGSGDREDLDRRVRSTLRDRKEYYQQKRSALIAEMRENASQTKIQERKAKWNETRKKLRQQVKNNLQKIELTKLRSLTKTIQSLNDKAYKAHKFKKRAKVPFQSRQLWMIILAGHAPALQALTSVIERKDELIAYRTKLDNSAIKMQRWWRKTMSTINSIDLETLESMRCRQYKSLITQQIINTRLKQFNNASNIVTCFIQTVGTPSFRFQILMQKNDYFRISAVKIQRWWRIRIAPRERLKQQLNKRWLRLERQVAQAETKKGRDFRPLPASERRKIISDIIFKHFKKVHQRRAASREQLQMLQAKTRVVAQYVALLQDMGLTGAVDSKSIVQNDRSIPAEIRELLNNEFEMSYAELKNTIRRSSQQYSMKVMNELIEEKEGKALF